MIKIKKKNISIAFTPYNIFLSYGIAISNQEEFEHYLFVFPEFSQSDLFLEVLTEQKSSPFHEVIYFYHGHSFVQKLKKLFILRRSLRKLKFFLKKNTIDTVYVFTDAKIVSQIVFRYFEKEGIQIKGIYVEEGTDAYMTMGEQKQGIFKNLVTRIIYGAWVEYVPVVGLSRWIDEVQLTFPQYVRPELKPKKIISYPKEALLNLKNTDYFKEYYRKFQFNKEQLEKAKALILVENTRFSEDPLEYKKNICEAVAMFKKKNMPVAIKYHPNEPQEDYLGLANEDMVCIIPQAFPCEFLYLDGFVDLKVIIGDATTALLTACWTLSDVLVITLSNMTQYSNEWMSKVFDQLDIKQVDSFEEVKKLI